MRGERNLKPNAEVRLSVQLNILAAIGPYASVPRIFPVTRDSKPKMLVTNIAALLHVVQPLHYVAQ